MTGVPLLRATYLVTIGRGGTVTLSHHDNLLSAMQAAVAGVKNGEPVRIHDLTTGVVWRASARKRQKQASN